MPESGDAAGRRACRIVLELQPDWRACKQVAGPNARYRGEATLTVSTQGRDICVDLSDIKLDRVDGESGTVHISGRVRARRPLPAIEEKIGAFEKLWHEPPPAVSVTVPDGSRYRTAGQEK